MCSEAMKMSRVWAMPNGDTFSVKPIGEFVKRYLAQSKVSIDPFARNKRWATYTNDINPNTEAESHMDAIDYLNMLSAQGVTADLIIFDPPYSPRQISECYKSFGKKVTMQDTQNGRLYTETKKAIQPLLVPNGVVLSFGWNSGGMNRGKHNSGFEIEEILLVCHGAAHNDTICMAERKQSHAGESD